MSKQGVGRGPAMDRPPIVPPGIVSLVTFLGVIAVVVFSATTWSTTRRLERTLDERLTRMEGQIKTIAKAGAPRPAARQGPDPNRVYTVKTDGAPAQGPAGAPIVIAEFSDFQ